MLDQSNWPGLAVGNGADSSVGVMTTLDTV